MSDQQHFLLQQADALSVQSLHYLHRCNRHFPAPAFNSQSIHLLPWLVLRRLALAGSQVAVMLRWQERVSGWHLRPAPLWGLCLWWPLWL